MSFLDNLPPRQVKNPNLEKKEGGVDNCPYDNDTSNFPAPIANDTSKQNVGGHTSKSQCTFFDPKITLNQSN